VVAGVDKFNDWENTKEFGQYFIVEGDSEIIGEKEGAECGFEGRGRSSERRQAIQEDQHARIKKFRP
jgi:hypothetical protein